jgi:hypothetical protein
MLPDFSTYLQLPRLRPKIQDRLTVNGEIVTKVTNALYLVLAKLVLVKHESLLESIQVAQNLRLTMWLAELEISVDDSSCPCFQS